MKISLITVCFNSAATIRTAMESVFAQRGVDVEYIVVDGGSTDGTVEIVEGFSHKESKGSLEFKWISEKDEGMYDAINKGIAMASGDVIGILNADDVLASDEVLAVVAGAFGDTVDALYADIRFVRDERHGQTSLCELRDSPTARYYSARRWRPWMLQWGFMPPHPSFYARRELFGTLGGYKLGYLIAADYELLIRFLRKAGLRTRYLPECLVTMRLGGRSTRGWRSTLTLNCENVRANRENGYFCCLAMMLPKYLFKVWELRPAFVARSRGARKPGAGR
jgi:glycosyltransferase involved in cell wall biosynthesis